MIRELFGRLGSSLYAIEVDHCVENEQTEARLNRPDETALKRSQTTLVLGVSRACKPLTFQSFTNSVHN